MKKIAIFTGSRAEYSIQYSVIKAIESHPKLQHYLLVGSGHFDKTFGYTKAEIEKDFEIYSEIKMENRGDDLFSTTQSVGHIILNLSKVLKELKPDILMICADRFEGLAAMIAGSQMGIPIAHIEGGDLTQGGALDDTIRHAMTKLAHLHFATNKKSAERIRKLGEENWRVFNVGFPPIDFIRQGNYATPEMIKSKLGIDVKKPLILFTQHPITTEVDSAVEQLKPSLEALKLFAKKGVQVLITYPNIDAGSRAMLGELTFENMNIKVVKHLGRYLYHGLLKGCADNIGVCVGNSSSGIKETPAFGCPTVNIGSRQKDRLQSSNVLNVGYDASAIRRAVRKSLWDSKFRADCKRCENPYGKGGGGKIIADVLADIELGKRLIQKKMTY